SLPYVPGTEVPIIDTKAGDLNVHLGGAAAFLLLGLRERVDPLRRRHGLGMSRVLLWAVWLAGFGFAAATNRGGMLAALAAIIVVLVLRPAVAGRRVVLLGTVGFVLISSLLLSNLEIALNEGRPV